MQSVASRGKSSGLSPGVASELTGKTKIKFNDSLNVTPLTVFVNVVN